MAGTASDDFAVGRSFEGGSSAQQRSQANSEALAEWRSSEQVENGSPSTSLPYWDSDDDDDHGPKPSQLYYKYTWKIEKFSQINKRELKSNVFDVGGYKWYILIYPQGCDVSNHLSLFLCVANHEKLLPGWSHFAQFTIAVVNKDPKKSKYSDTLHRFWKKEHDWGWKKFMELAKVSDGFLDADTLVIKAQVQVIRERVDRPFRCLDFQYRRELVRVYLTNIEQICRRFVEEKRCKLGKLLEDKARWSSFCAFWLGIDQNVRWRMSKEKTDSLLKVVVKHFFVEKEVTSTLVMDSLFSGLKALEGETQTKQGGLKNLESVELSGPIVFMEKDTFILADDVLLLLERAATEPLPPKDDKGAQNRTKDGGSGEDFSKDSIERDERRLTELGRKTIEIFVLAHIFSSKIEVAYQEAVALKRQEELIREEEASWIAESEQKSKRGVADKDKKSKKKQGKHKRNSHKVKEKGKNGKPDVVVEDEPKPEIHADRRNQFLLEEVELIGNPNPEEDVSDMSDSINAVPELLHPDYEDRDSSPVWDTDASEAILLTESSSSGITGFLGVENRERKSSSMMDDSSSTCSTDSLPSVTTMNGTSQVDSFQKPKSQDTPRREHQQGRMTREATGLAFDACSKRSDAFSDGRQLHDVSESSKAAEFGGAVVHLLQQHAKGPVKHVTKEEKDYTLQRKLTVTEGINADKPAELKTTGILSSPKSPPKNLPYAVQLRSELKPTATSNTILITKSSSESPTRADKTASANLTETTVLSNAYAQKTASPKPVVKSTALPVPISTANSMALPVPTSTANSMALLVPISTTNVMGKQVPDLTETAKVHKQFSTDERPMPQALLTTEKPAVPQVMFRPLSAPLVPGSQPPRPVISVVQSVPALAHSANEAGRLVPEPSSPVTPSHVTHSYRNIIMGNHVTTCSSSYSQLQSPNSAVNPSYSYSQSQPPALCSPPNYFLTKSEKTDPISVGPGHSFGMIGHGSLANISSTSINRNPLVVNNMHGGSQWIDNSRMDNSRSINYDPPLHNDTQNLNNYNPMQNMSRDHFPVEFTPDTSGSQNHSALTEAFPHLDIINDLLDDEYGVELTSNASSSVQNFINEPHHLNRQLTFPRDIRMGGGSGPSISSCRLERSHSYRDNEFRYNYNSAGGQFHPNFNSQANNLHLYPNIQVDGLLPNQWQMAGTNLSYSNMRSLEDDGLSYNFPNYPNLSSSVNGYTMFRPSNGL